MADFDSRDISGDDWQDQELRRIANPSQAVTDEAWLNAHQRYYCFLGGPKHWERETFKAMKPGDALNTLDEQYRQQILRPIEEDDHFGEDMVSTSTYVVRRLRFGSTGMRRDFLVYEGLHHLDSASMALEFIETYYTPDGKRRQQNGARIRGRENAEDS